MREDALLRQAKVLGETAPEELTYGELMEVLELADARERRVLQGLALVAYRHALLIHRILAGQTLPQLHEAFPFWEEETVRQAKLEHYRHLMQRLAQGQGGKENT